MSTIYKKHQCATGYRLQTQASFIYELSNCCSSHPHSRAQCVAYTSLLIRQMILLHWRQTTDLFFNEGELQNAHKIHQNTEKNAILNSQFEREEKMRDFS